MSAEVIRKKYAPKLIGLAKYSRVTAWVIVGGYIAQIIAAIVAGHILMQQPQSWLTALVSVFLIVFIGTRLRGLNNIVHECSHATFSTVRSDNAVIGKICSSLTLGSFMDYREEHLSHHAHLGDYERDMDLAGIKDLKLHEPLSRRVLLRHITNPMLGRHLPYYLRVNLSSRDGVVFFVMKIALLFFAIAFSVVVPVTGVLFMIVPFVFAYSTLNYWADCLDHAGLAAEDDDLDASRNIVAPKVLRWLFFPRNDCFHLVHHLFPNVPARHLETAHLQLSTDEAYRARPNAVRVPMPRKPAVVAGLASDKSEPAR